MYSLHSKSLRFILVISYFNLFWTAFVDSFSPRVKSEILPSPLLLFSFFRDSFFMNFSHGTLFSTYVNFVNPSGYNFCMLNSTSFFFDFPLPPPEYSYIETRFFESMLSLTSPQRTLQLSTISGSCLHGSFS